MNKTFHNVRKRDLSKHNFAEVRTWSHYTTNKPFLNDTLPSLPIFKLSHIKSCVDFYRITMKMNFHLKLKPSYGAAISWRNLKFRFFFSLSIKIVQTTKKARFLLICKKQGGTLWLQEFIALSHHGRITPNLIILIRNNKTANCKPYFVTDINTKFRLA